MVSESTLRQRIETAGNALDRGDAEGMADLYTPDGQLLPPGSDVVTGPDAIAEFWQGVFDSGVDAVDLEPVDVEAHDDAGIEVGRYTLDGADGTTLDRGKYVVVWKHHDGEWKLHRDIWNSSRSEEH